MANGFLEEIGYRKHLPTLFWWQGVSGAWKPFSVLTIREALYWNGPSIYAMVRNDPLVGRKILYFGRADKQHTGDRLVGHEKWDAACQLGMNEIQVHLLPNTDCERAQVERDLIEGHKPPLNVQHVGPRRTALGRTLAEVLSERRTDGALSGVKWTLNQ